MATGKLLTGLRELDELVGGFEPNELVVIAGRPSTGKTAVIAAIAAGMAARQSRLVFVASPEMSAAAMARRISNGRAGLCLGNGRRSQREPDISALDRLYIDDDQALLPDDIGARARKAAQGRKLAALIVDPVWCLGGGPNQPSSDWATITSTAIRRLRAACDELGVPLLATVGMQRSAQPGAPSVEQAHGGREVEAAADTVLLVHPRELETRSITITLAKHPRGQVGTLTLTAA